MSEPGWSEQDSRHFLEYGEYLVPEREEQIDAICSLIPHPVGSRTILELACGAGVLARAILQRHPESEVCGLDGSPTMLGAAASELAAFGDRFRGVEFDLAATSWRGRWRDCWAVVSSLAIHHLDHPGKRQLFGDVRNMLAPGGAFVVADVVEPASPEARALAARKWDDAVRQRSSARRGDLALFVDFQDRGWNCFHSGNEDPDVDKPSGLVDQLLWLREAGFVGVEVVWAKAGHAVFGGYRGR